MTVAVGVADVGTTQTIAAQLQAVVTGFTLKVYVLLTATAAESNDT